MLSELYKQGPDFGGDLHRALQEPFLGPDHPCIVFTRDVRMVPETLGGTPEPDAGHGTEEGAAGPPKFLVVPRRYELSPAATRDLLSKAGEDELMRFFASSQDLAEQVPERGPAELDRTPEAGLGLTPLESDAGGAPINRPDLEGESLSGAHPGQEQEGNEALELEVPAAVDEGVSGLSEVAFSFEIRSDSDKPVSD